jgi:short-subunit dehydrogenase
MCPPVASRRHHVMGGIRTMSNIEGKVVVITGASSSLGEAATRHLARHGAKLVLGARRLERLQAYVKELSLGASAAVRVISEGLRQEVKPYLQQHEMITP